MECECGHLHASNFSDVIVRNPKDFSICQIGETGIIQVVTALADSYPGHSLLTEDIGAILGEDDCPCGRKGKYFRIDGRIKSAEVRGAVILMKNVNVKYLAGGEITNVKPLPPYSDEACEFLADLSKRLQKDRRASQYPDVISFAFSVGKQILQN